MPEIYVLPVESIKDAVKKAEKGKVILKKGIHFLSKPVELGAENNGITVCCEEGAKICGCVEIENPLWEKTQKGIYRTETLKGLNPDMLFLNGEAMILARYPNYREDVLPLGGTASAKEIKGRVKNYKNPAGGFIRAMHEAGWGGNSYFIEGKDQSSPSGLKLKWIGDNNRGSGFGNELVVENVFEELDDEKEWYYSSQDGYLYFKPVNEDELNGVFHLGILSELFKIKGASDIKFQNVTFCETKRSMFEKDKQYRPLLRGDWCIMPAGAVSVVDSENITFENCVFENIGSNGIYIGDYGKGHKITGCRFSNIGSTAVQIVGSPSAVYEPSFWKNDMYPDLPVHRTKVEHPEKTGPASEEYPRDILIENNFIENVGIYEKQSSGVNLSVCFNVKILHNTICKSARSNINVNDGTFGGHEIAYNDIFDSQRETQDHGPFNSWGRDRFWSVPKYNAGGKYGDKIRRYKKDGKIYDLTKIDSLGETVIHHNRFSHSANAPHSWGIDLDDGSSNYAIYNNLCIGIGIKLREGFNRRVWGNVLIGGPLNIHVPYNMSRDEVHDNFIVCQNPVMFAGADRKRFLKSESKICNNIFLTPDGAGVQGFLSSQNKTEKFSDSKTASEILAILKNKYDLKDFDESLYGKENTKKPEEYVYIPDKSENKNKCRISGAQISDITEEIKSSTAFSSLSGAYVEKTGLLSLAGFEKRDIILRVGDREITCGADLKDIPLADLFFKPVCVYRANSETVLHKK